MPYYTVFDGLKACCGQVILDHDPHSKCRVCKATTCPHCSMRKRSCRQNRIVKIPQALCDSCGLVWHQRKWPGPQFRPRRWRIAVEGRP